MELSKQVPNKELCQRLKELNVKQESYFAWINTDMKGRFVLEKSRFSEEATEYDFSAFTVAELGELLPQTLLVKGKIYYLAIPNGNGLKWIDYITYSENSGVGTLLVAYPLMGGTTEADARAKMLIYLLENHLLNNK